MIKKELLKPGQILFYRVIKNTGFTGQFIGWAQHVIGKTPLHGSQSYCHVGILDTDTNYLLEAKWPKTRRWLIDWNKIEKHYGVEVWEVKNVTPEQVKLAIDWCHDNLGEWYDVGLFVWGLFDFKHAEVCSTFVGKAWEDAGIEFKEYKEINKNPDFWVPDELIANVDIIERVQ